MKSVPLNAFPRQAVRRGEVKKLRSTGRVPGVVYGRNTKPTNVELNHVEIRNLMHHSASENVLVDLAVNSAKRLALVQDVQHHPLSGAILHVDFHEVAENEMVTVSVPVESTGEAVGVKTGGGVLEHVLFKLKVRALPKDLPEVIAVDVTSLEIGKSLHISDITAPPGVEILGEKKAVVLSVAAPITEAEEAAATAGPATADVEMIKEKKEDGAEAPAAGDKGKPAAEKKDAKAGAEKKEAKK